MTGTPPKVFISYSHDTAEHQARVLALADQLRGDGIDAEIDQYNVSPPEGWPLWCERRIEAADFVLMVCTETYYRRVSGDGEPGKGLGVVWEAAIIRQLLYDAGALSDKFVPVLFSDGVGEYVPTLIRGRTRYAVDTEEGHEDLYRLLTGQPRLLRPALGKIRSLPARRRQWTEGTMAAATSPRAFPSPQGCSGGGDVHFTGRVNTGGGDFVSRDQIKIIREDQQSNINDYSALLKELRSLLDSLRADADKMHLIKVNFTALEQETRQSKPHRCLIEKRFDKIVDVVRSTEGTATRIEKIVSAVQKLVAMGATLFP